VERIPASVVEAVARHLDEYGIRLHGDLSQLTWPQPVPMNLEISGRSVNLAAVYLPKMSATAALQAVHSVPIDVPVLPQMRSGGLSLMRCPTNLQADSVQ
jgi:hypothetical protein